MLSAEKIRITPRRGEYCLLDRSDGGLARHTLFQLPGKMGKGVLVTPTVDGNILLGPTSEDIDDKTDKSTTGTGLAYVLEQASRDIRHLPLNRIITTFAGLRAHSVDDDFIIGPSPDVEGLVNVAGIESPGLTSAPAIAMAVEEMVTDLLAPRPNPKFNPVRKAPPRFRHLNNEERSLLIAQNPDYGRIVCRCENVTRAEVVAVLRSPLGVRDLDAIKRRTRVGMGRCQSGFCVMRLPEILFEELGLQPTEICKSGAGSAILLQPNKTGL